MPKEQQDFDVIVIGSGIGGLTVAAMLAKLEHKKVLVLEQHFIAGGFTHAFERKGKFHWDVGLHYVGEMGEGSIYRAMFDYISNDKLKWFKMPNVFEKFVYPDFTFEVNSDPDQFQADLIKQFPHERTAIRRYCSDVQKAAFWFVFHLCLDLFPRPLHLILKPAIRHFGAIIRPTTQEYLDRNFQDLQLKALLASQWGDYGLPPSQSCFGIHALIVNHYFQGGWYPVGSGTSITESIIPTIEQEGGKLQTQRRVTEIMVEAGVAVGVKVQHTARPDAEMEIYRAPIIISDAGAYNTYLNLIPSSYPLTCRESIQKFRKGASVSTVYLGLKDSPQQLGFQGENHWIYSTYNHDEIELLQSPDPDVAYAPKLAYLSFPSLKNPLAKGHTAEIIGITNYDRFADWQEQRWRRRDGDYATIKSNINKSLIGFVDSHYPGFQDLIEYVEVSTPLTVEHFDASDRGTIYNIPCTPERLDLPWISSITPIKNLYLTGSDALSPGIMGAMLGGVKTAGIVSGIWGLFKMMTTICFKTIATVIKK